MHRRIPSKMYTKMFSFKIMHSLKLGQQPKVCSRIGIGKVDRKFDSLVVNVITILLNFHIIAETHPDEMYAFFELHQHLHQTSQLHQLT